MLYLTWFKGVFESPLVCGRMCADGWRVLTALSSLADLPQEPRFPLR